MTLLPGDLRTAEDVRQFIQQKLCEKENLVLNQFPVSETVLHKRGQICGIQYVLHGPRSVKLGAVWACDTNMIYLYDAAGQRYEKLQLRQRIMSEAA